MNTATKATPKLTFSQRNNQQSAFNWICLLSAAAVNAPIASQRLTGSNLSL